MKSLHILIENFELDFISLPLDTRDVNPSNTEFSEVPMAASAPATVISRHVTSEGVVRYVRTPTGGLQVQLLPAGAPVELLIESGPAGSDNRAGQELARCA